MFLQLLVYYFNAIVVIIVLLLLLFLRMHVTGFLSKQGSLSSLVIDGNDEDLSIPAKPVFTLVWLYEKWWEEDYVPNQVLRDLQRCLFLLLFSFLFNALKYLFYACSEDRIAQVITTTIDAERPVEFSYLRLFFSESIPT